MRENYQRLREQSHSAVRILLVVWLVVMLATAPVAGQTDTATPTATPTSETAPCATGPPVPGQDEVNETESTTGDLEIAMVNDRSSSMDQGTRMEDLKNASTGFVDRLENPDEAAAISFGPSPSLDQELTTDYQAVNDEINALTPDGGTDLQGGIETAHTELTSGTNASGNATKVMVVFTDAAGPDAIQNGNGAINASEDAQADGIRVFVVGVGDPDEQFLEDIASSPEDAYIAPDSSDLDGIYQEISGEVEAIGGDLRVETRSLFKPNATHPYEVKRVTYYDDGTTELEDVTEQAAVNTTNTSILSVNESGHTLSAVNDSSTATWVRVDATAGGVSGCTNVIVAEATVENLQLLPNGTWRVNAVLGDSFFQALLVALFVGVAATRFSGAFAGLGGAQMTLTIGWFAGYVPWVFAALGMFLALFIGLNLAENVDIQVRR